METAALLAELRAAGLVLGVVHRAGYCEEFTVLVSPRRVLSDAHRLHITAHKEGLVDLLYAEWCDQVFPRWWGR